MANFPAQLAGLSDGRTRSVAPVSEPATGTASVFLTGAAGALRLLALMMLRLLLMRVLLMMGVMLLLSGVNGADIKLGVQCGSV